MESPLSSLLGGRYRADVRVPDPSAGRLGTARCPPSCHDDGGERPRPGWPHGPSPRSSARAPSDKRVSVSLHRRGRPQSRPPGTDPVPTRYRPGGPGRGFCLRRPSSRGPGPAGPQQVSPSVTEGVGGGGVPESWQPLRRRQSPACTCRGVPGPRILLRASVQLGGDRARGLARCTGHGVLTRRGTANIQPREVQMQPSRFGCLPLGRAQGRRPRDRQDSDRSLQEPWRRGLGAGTWPDPACHLLPGRCLARGRHRQVWGTPRAHGTQRARPPRQGSCRSPRGGLTTMTSGRESWSCWRLQSPCRRARDGAN